MASSKLLHHPLSSSAKSHRRKFPIRCFCLLIITMSSILILLFSLFIFSSPSSSRHHHHHNSRQLPSDTPPANPSPVPAAQIRLACNATRYPDECVSSLSEPGRVPPDPKPSQIIHSAISVSFQNLKTAQSKVKSILDASVGNLNRTNAANTCLQLLSYSEHRTQSTDQTLTRGKIKDARAWMSAALVYQYDSWSALKYVNDTKQVGETMSFLDGLIHLSSNALSMMVSYDNFGDNVASWTYPATERDGFWDKTGPGTGPSLSFPSGLKEDVTVCKDGKCRYKTVQEAVDAAPEDNGMRKFVIKISEGVYEETVRVPFEKKNVVFIGDGMGKTVITGSLNAGMPGITTYNTATVGVVGDGFMARDMTFQNTAGPDAHQAVAFRSDSDFSLLENCEFLGNQDTLYAHGLRQFYKSCRIQGNVDFIFGNSASVFQDCEILIAPRQVNPEKGEKNAVTAQGRVDPSQSTGFVFLNCVINGTEEYMKLYKANPKVHKTFLGRPWKDYSRTVFIGCNLESLITPDGWLPWSGDFALKTLYYGESKNTGPGSDRSKRVSWSSEIPDEHVHVYSVANFIQADEWGSMSA
ncbi:unnamed protein product [Thlaspi arvense]|uniref:pectinesterase n=1 Tax=Thlaspi arvense TaxID=13288 RepID=A0AAU9SST1_THLAR|nr:unnamed protein product [Thlaspi arvense]